MGAVFSALAEDGTVTNVELTQVHCQAATTRIPTVARRIRAGEVPVLPSFTGLGPGISFLACRPEEAQGHIIEMLGLLGGIKETQLLSPIRRSPAGITTINAAMHRLSATGKATWSGLAMGDPVIHLENEYEALVWNGSLGMVEEALPDGVQIQWDDHEKAVAYREDRREALDLANAISVYKA
jgi:exodeoxyribonuclease V alpha subunit